MKKVLLFVAALSFSGVAVAQDMAPPASTNPNETTPPANTAMPASDMGAPMTSTSGAAPADSMSTSAAPAADTGAKTYPKCTRKLRDNCVNAGGK